MVDNTVRTIFLGEDKMQPDKIFRERSVIWFTDGYKIVKEVDAGVDWQHPIVYQRSQYWGMYPLQDASAHTSSVTNDPPVLCQVRMRQRISSQKGKVTSVPN